jgi:hypothetical protein
MNQRELSPLQIAAAEHHNSLMEFNEIVSTVSRLKDEYERRDMDVWFRGHSAANWPIKSSLHRHVEDWLRPLEDLQPTGQLPDSAKESRLRIEYGTLYQHFKADAWSLLRGRERSPWGIVFAMQHYGFPTRLLDWTESFACAVYFAQTGRKPGDAAAIFALVPQAVNLQALGTGQLMAMNDKCEFPAEDTESTKPLILQVHLHPETGLDDKKDGYPPTIAVAPFLSNPRMIAQRSVFTMMGDSFLPLERQFGDRLMDEGYLVKFVLEPDSYDEVESFLRIAGSGDFGYFPDFEGLRRKAIRRKERLVKSMAESCR